MQNSLWNRKIPGLFGFFLTALSVIITVFLVRQGVIFLTRASPSEIPKNIKVTNISDNAFTITYTTDEAVIGSLNIGATTDSEQIVLDDRDQLSQSLTPYKTHSLTAKNLKPDTNYKYSITSGSEKVIDGDKLFEVSTVNEIESPTTQKPLAGRVITNEGEPASGILVFLSVDDSQEISTLTKEDGSYLIPLNSLRSAELTSYHSLSTNSELRMILTDGSSTSNVKLTVEQTDPVPAIILANNYDFRSGNNPINNAPAEEPSASFPDVESTASGTDPNIESPNSNQSFSDEQPEFKGTAQPNETVEIEIHSDENIKTEVATDENGRWSFRPQTPLSPGEHTITIKSRGSDGIIKSITRNFTVFAEGTQVTESATPSAAIASPTPIPTLTPTISPIPTNGEMQLSQTPTPSIPPTGTESFMLAGLAGVALTIFGLAVFAITRYKLPL